MTESTFLSRSFGDQGVRLRIRKEPRTLLYVPRLYVRIDNCLVFSDCHVGKDPFHSQADIATVIVQGIFHIHTRNIQVI